MSADQMQKPLPPETREDTIDALAKVIRDLNPLSDIERKRVLETAAAFFDIVL